MKPFRRSGESSHRRRFHSCGASRRRRRRRHAAERGIRLALERGGACGRTDDRARPPRSPPRRPRDRGRHSRLCPGGSRPPAAILRGRSRSSTTTPASWRRPCSSSGTRGAAWCGATRPVRTSPTTSRGSRWPTSSRRSLVQGAGMSPSDWNACGICGSTSRRPSVGDRPQVDRGVCGAVMRRREPSRGYAMLAVLLVAVLAATFALVVVGAGLQVVEGADASGWRAVVAERQALAAVVPLLRWHPLATTGAAEGAAAAGRGESRGCRLPACLRQAAMRRGPAGAAGRASPEGRSRPGAAQRTVGDGRDVSPTPKSPPFSLSGERHLRGRLPWGREHVAFVLAPALSRPPAFPRRRPRRSLPCGRRARRSRHLARGIEIHDAPSPSEFPNEPTGTGACRSRTRWLGEVSADSCCAAAAELMAPGPALMDGATAAGRVCVGAGSARRAGDALCFRRRTKS